ncbi:MAG: hypothetical protein HXY40_13800 [Chloroflexi bacterium]|nr:hypothetical protein [Chloroflexota bacterium]
MLSREQRAVNLRDLPLVRRLSQNGSVLNSEIGLTRSVGGLNISAVLLPPRGLYTLLARVDQQALIGQLRLRPEDPNAQLVFIAPRLESDRDDTAWLHLLDALAQEAGRRGAHTLMAEVDESSALFETMRLAGFAIYARQEIWRCEPGTLRPPRDALELQAANDSHLPGIHALYAQTMPRMVQQIAEVNTQGLVYRENDRIEGFIALAEGKQGVYLMPCINPERYRLAAGLITAAAARVQHAHKVPLYVRVRRYQEWLEGPLEKLGFSPWTQQAVMVRHIAAGIRQAGFASLRQALDVLPAPAGRATETLIDFRNQE